MEKSENTAKFLIKPPQYTDLFQIKMPENYQAYIDQDNFTIL